MNPSEKLPITLIFKQIGILASFWLILWVAYQRIVLQGNFHVPPTPVDFYSVFLALPIIVGSGLGMLTIENQALLTRKTSLELVVLVAPIWIYIIASSFFRPLFPGIYLANQFVFSLHEELQMVVTYFVVGAAIAAIVTIAVAAAYALIKEIKTTRHSPLREPVRVVSSEEMLVGSRWLDGSPSKKEVIVFIGFSVLLSVASLPILSFAGVPLEVLVPSTESVVLPYAEVILITIGLAEIFLFLRKRFPTKTRRFLTLILTLSGIASITGILSAVKTAAGLQTFWNSFLGISSIVLAAAFTSVVLFPSIELISSHSKNRVIRLVYDSGLILSTTVAFLVFSFQISGFQLLPTFFDFADVLWYAILAIGVYVGLLALLTMYFPANRNKLASLIGPFAVVTLVILASYLPQSTMQALTTIGWYYPLLLWAAGIAVTRKWPLLGLSTIAASFVLAELQGSSTAWAIVVSTSLILPFIRMIKRNSLTQVIPYSMFFLAGAVQGFNSYVVRNHFAGANQVIVITLILLLFGIVAELNLWHSKHAAKKVLIIAFLVTGSVVGYLVGFGLNPSTGVFPLILQK